jgi:hypothetical protein
MDIFTLEPLNGIDLGELIEVTVDQIQHHLEAGAYSSLELTEWCLRRIEKVSYHLFLLFLLFSTLSYSFLLFLFFVSFLFFIYSFLVDNHWSSVSCTLSYIMHICQWFGHFGHCTIITLDIILYHAHLRGFVILNTVP